MLGSVAFLPGLEEKNSVLIIEASSLTGGEAIDDFLLDDNAFHPFLASIKEPDGTLPYFEVILESNNIDGNAGPFHVVTFHVYN